MGKANRPRERRKRSKAPMNTTKPPDWIKPLAYRELAKTVQLFTSALTDMDERDCNHGCWIEDLRAAESLSELSGLEWAARGIK